MNDSFVSRKDRIISSAIEIISDSGLSSLTTHNLALKENMSDALLYRYFGSINEVLVEVVDYYARFDDSIRQTVSAKQVTNIQKIKDYFEAYATYYENYYAISTLMLQYEELLHNADTREKITKCITERQLFLEELFDKAIAEHEITTLFSGFDLATQVTGVLMAYILKRRIVYIKTTFKQEFMGFLNKWFELIAI